MYPSRSRTDRWYTSLSRNIHRYLVTNKQEWIIWAVSTTANSRRQSQSSEPIKTRSNYMQLTRRAGKRITIGFGFTSDWMKKWRELQIVWRSWCKTNYFSTLNSQFRTKRLTRSVCDLLVLPQKVITSHTGTVCSLFIQLKAIIANATKQSRHVFTTAMLT